MDWTGRKGKTKRRVWDMGKSNRSPPIKARKEVEGTDGERGGRESMQTQGREVIPIHPSVTILVAKGPGLPFADQVI